MYEKLVELLEPYMSGEPCDGESGSCELTNCRTCDAITLANRLIFHDVVPVVRCKDCKHSDEDDFDGSLWCCRDKEIEVAENHYCSYGERKDGEG